MRWTQLAITLLSACAAIPAQQFLAESPPELAAVLPGLGSFHRGTTGDYDGDGDADIAVAGLFTLRLLRNDGTGGITDATSTLPPLPLTGNVTTVMLVDLDGDGQAELFVNGYGFNLLYDHTPAGWVDRSTGLPPGLPPLNWISGDFDQDGDTDLAGAAFLIAGGSNTLLENQGNLTFAASTPFPGQHVSMRAGDIDGDGDLDLLLGSPATLLRNDGAMLFTNVTAAQLMGAGAADYADFGDVEGDGDLDLVLGGVNTTASQLLLNSGAGFFTPVANAIQPLASVHRAMRLLDVDADGDLDLLRTALNGTPVLSRNGGSGQFTDDPGAMPAISAASASIFDDDLDGDGDADLLMLALLGDGHLLRNLHREVLLPQQPNVGQSWAVHVWNAPGYATVPRMGLLGIGLQRLPQPLPLTPFGNLWLDLSAPLMLDTLMLLPGPGPTIRTFVIPNGPGLQGVALHVQALIEAPTGNLDTRLTTVATGVIQ